MTNEPYRSTAGTTRTLKRDCMLDYNGEDYSPGEPHAPYRLRDGEKDRGETLLKKGTKLHIDTVRLYVIDARGEWIGAVGRVSHPGTGQELKFLYTWLSADSAPWYY